MTYWKCPQCAGEDSSKENIVMKICPCCQIAMQKYPNPNHREVEVKNDGD